MRGCQLSAFNKYQSCQILSSTTQGCTIPRLSLSTSTALFGGQKVKRRKQEMRADNPQLVKSKGKERSIKNQALDNLDKHYNEYYGKKWNSMRLALLSKSKHCAVVNNYADPEETIEKLKSEGCIDIGLKYAENCAKFGPPEETITTEPNHATMSVNENIENAPDESETKENPSAQHVERDDDEIEAELLENISLNVEDAAKRYIDPEERIIGETSNAMYDYVPTTDLKGMEDFVEEKDYYNNFGAFDPIKVENYPRLNFPKHLRVFMHPRSVHDNFPKVRQCMSGNLDYYTLDGGSLLPVVALDLKPGDGVLDMCAAPGGKTIIAIQSMLPSRIVCNDVSIGRLRRLTSIIEQYFGSGSGIGNVKDNITFLRREAEEIHDYGVYDKIICDVPCFSDRHSVTSVEANVFASKMTRNRLILPQQQSQILKAGLLYLKVGGALVYSTCTLSPVQNHGVVNMALKDIAQETGQEYAVCDLTEALKPLNFMGTIYGKKQGVTYGNLVVPNICSNFGPTYFCRIIRKS